MIQDNAKLKVSKLHHLENIQRFTGNCKTTGKDAQIMYVVFYI